MTKRRRSPVETGNVKAEMCSPALRLRIVRGLPFFSSLDAEVVTAAASLFREKGFSPDEMICFSHSPAAHFYVVASGLVKLIHQTEQGRFVILDLLGGGGFFGYLPRSRRETYAYSVQALTPTCTLAIDSRSFRRLLDAHPSVALDLLAVVSERLEAAHERIRELNVAPVEQRVASTLMQLGERFGERREVGLLIQLPLSREDLAEMSGTTTETASRVVSDLRRDGVIRTGRRWISIADLARLASLANRQP